MTSIGQQLRAAREARGISLDDIALSTRINRTFLDELERDVTPKLPPTYVHAFIKAFAREVGLDPEKLFASAKPPEPAADVPAPPRPDAAAPPPAPRPAPEAASPVAPSEERKAGQRSLLMTLFIVVTAAFAVSIFWLRGDRAQHPPEEVTFNDVVRERESKAAGPDSSRPAAVEPAKPAADALPDTLILEGAAQETVWVRMASDGRRPAEYTFRPAVKMTWRGREGFMLSLGDGGAMTFTLNGTPLGRLGAAHRPLKNLAITRETLRQARTAAGAAHRGSR